METVAWERVEGSLEEQKAMVCADLVAAALDSVQVFALSRVEILSLCAALLRESAKEIGQGVVVQAVGFVGAQAVSMSDFLETDSVTAMAMPGQVSALVQQATPALWRGIAEVLAAPPAMFEGVVRAPPA